MAPPGRDPQAWPAHYKWGHSREGWTHVWGVEGGYDGRPAHRTELTRTWGRPASVQRGDVLGTAQFSPAEVHMDGTVVAPAHVFVQAYYGADLPEAVLGRLRELHPGAEVRRNTVEGLRGGGPGGWDVLGGMTPNQLAQLVRENGLPEDRSEVVHEFPDGWTVRRLTTYGDMRREGVIMHHCWDTESPEDDQLPLGARHHHSLRDPANAPKASFYYYPPGSDTGPGMAYGWASDTADLTGARFENEYGMLPDDFTEEEFDAAPGRPPEPHHVVHESYGHGDGAVKPEYRERIDGWLRSMGGPAYESAHDGDWGRNYYFRRIDHQNAHTAGSFDIHDDPSPWWDTVWKWVWSPTDGFIAWPTPADSEDGRPRHDEKVLEEWRRPLDRRTDVLGFAMASPSGVDAETYRQPPPDLATLQSVRQGLREAFPDQEVRVEGLETPGTPETREPPAGAEPTEQIRPSASWAVQELLGDIGRPWMIRDNVLHVGEPDSHHDQWGSTGASVYDEARDGGPVIGKIWSGDEDGEPLPGGEVEVYYGRENQRLKPVVEALWEAAVTNGGTLQLGPGPAAREAQSGAGWAPLAPREAAGGADHDGAMVALYVPLGDLAVEGGEPVEDMHITLCYFEAKAADRDDWDELHGALEAIANQTPPLEGSVNGLGEFRNDETVLWAYPSLPGLAELRHRVFEACEDAGFPVSKEHDWAPHVTLAYGKGVEDGPEIPEGGAPLEVPKLTLCVADERTEFELSGEGIEKKLGGETLPQRRRRWEAQGPVDLRAVEELPGGWTVAALGDYDTMGAVGRQMLNCWRGKRDDNMFAGRPEEAAAFLRVPRVLLDPDGLPAVAYYHQEENAGREDDPNAEPVITATYGPRNDWPTPEAARALVQHAVNNGHSIQRALHDVASERGWVSSGMEKMVPDRVPEPAPEPGWERTAMALRPEDASRLPTLYHNTFAANVPSILERGILPRSEAPPGARMHGWSEHSWPLDGRVYLKTGPEQGYHGERDAVIAVDPNRLDPAGWEMDEDDYWAVGKQGVVPGRDDYAEGHQPEADEPGLLAEHLFDEMQGIFTVAYRGAIPPEALTVVDPGDPSEDHEFSPAMTVTAGTTLYHVAPQSARAQIQERGLVPQPEDMGPGWPRYIWLFDDRRKAEGMAASQARWRPQDIWRVRHEGLHLTRDPHSPEGPEESYKNAFATMDTVPPDRLELLPYEGEAGGYASVDAGFWSTYPHEWAQSGGAFYGGYGRPSRDDLRRAEEYLRGVEPETYRHTVGPDGQLYCSDCGEGPYATEALADQHAARHRTAGWGTEEAGFPRVEDEDAETWSWRPPWSDEGWAKDLPGLPTTLDRIAWQWNPDGRLWIGAPGEHHWWHSPMGGSGGNVSGTLQYRPGREDYGVLADLHKTDIGGGLDPAGLEALVRGRLAEMRAAGRDRGYWRGGEMQFGPTEIPVGTDRLPPDDPLRLGVEAWAARHFPGAPAA